MILLLDLGNTNLYVGVYRERKLVCSYRTYAERTRSSFEFKESLSQFLIINKIDVSLIDGAILSSVVPSMNNSILEAVELLIGKQCKLVSSSLKSGLAIRIDNPAELGSDLVCDSIGAINDYNEDCLIVDLGTATKLMYVTKEKVFHGCVIAPGIKISFESMLSSSAQLVDIQIKAPDHVIGKNTSDSMNSGVVFGHVEMINGLCKRIAKEAGKPLKKILTGGNSIYVKGLLNDEFIYNDKLIFDGLYDIFMKNN